MKLRAGWVLIAIAVIGGPLLLWWLLSGRAEQARNQATAARVDAGVAGVQAGNAQGAIAATIDQGARREIIERITRENTIRIMQAPGSGDPVPPAVWSEFLGSVCLRREAARSDPACAQLPQSGEGYVGQADPIGPAAK